MERGVYKSGTERLAPLSSLTDEQLGEAWVRRAVMYLCGLFRKTDQYDLECGALYHAAHGLALYRQRMFGSRKYGGEDVTDAATANVRKESATK